MNKEATERLLNDGFLTMRSTFKSNGSRYSKGCTVNILCSTPDEVMNDLQNTANRLARAMFEVMVISGVIDISEEECKKILNKPNR